MSFRAARDGKKGSKRDRPGWEAYSSEAFLRRVMRQRERDSEKEMAI